MTSPLGPTPSLNALRAFEAASRHLNFRLAGLELGVTQGAVAQQIRALEAELGLKLFERHPRTLVLTHNGQRIDMEGLEYQWRWQPLDDTRLLVNQAFHHIHPRYDDELDTTAKWFSDSGKPGTLYRIDEHTRKSAPTRATTIMLMQKLPYGVEFSATQHWVGAMKWTRNTQVRPYQRLDLRLAYPFRLGSSRGMLAYTVQNAFWNHGEFKASGEDPADRVVSERHWLSLRLDY